MRALVIVAFTAALASLPAQADKATLSASANQAYLDSNAKKHGVVVMPGIQYRVITAGKGASPHRHDCVLVHYAGSLIDGTMFDPTKAGEVAEAVFEVSGVIGGWTEALQLMREGDKWEVVIPPGLAYGKAGAGEGVIPPDQTLVFQIELLKVSPKPAGGCPTR